MTPLGIFHTIVSVVALLVAFVAIFRQGRIAPYSTVGKVYSGLTVVACLTAFGIFKTGKFSPGHMIGILILVLLLVVYVILDQKTTFLQTLCMSATLFLSMIPTVAETLTRLPVGVPFAPSQEAPLVKMCVGIVFVLFLLGVFLQFFSHKKMQSK